MALANIGIGTQGLGLGLISRSRATFSRIRNTIRPPRCVTEAARMVIKDATSVILNQAFIAAYVGDSVAKELYGYYKNGDLKAVMSVYLDSTANKYKFSIAKVTAEAVSVEFDKVAIGNLSAISQIDTPGTGQITHEAAPLTA